MQESTKLRLDRVCEELLSVASMIRKDTDEVTAGGDHIAIIRHFDKARLAVEMIKEAREALNDMVDNLSRVVIPDVMKAHQVKTLTLEGVGRVTVSYRYSCSMLDKQRGMDWLRDNGHGDLIQPTVNSSSLAAFSKNLLEVEGKELPEDIFKVGTSPFTSITKVK